MYFLNCKIKSPAHHIVLPAGKAFDRIEDFFIAGNAPAGTPFLPPIVGQVQDGITPTNLPKQDYLPGFVGLPFFSPRFVEAMTTTLQNEVEFHPCTIMCDGIAHPFFLARILNRMQLLDYEASNLNGPASQSRGNILRPNLPQDFFLAREEHPLKCYVFIASEKFKTAVNKHKLHLGFAPTI